MKLDELLLSQEQRDGLAEQILVLCHQRDKLTTVIALLSAAIMASDMAELDNPLIEQLQDYLEDTGVTIQ